MTLKIRLSDSSGHALFVKRILFLLSAVGACLCVLAIFAPGPIQKNSYMGAEYCATCHQKEYQSWQATPHAKATNNLALEKRRDKACLSCHGTGVYDQANPIIAGVSCEACHGPGEYYASLHVKKDPVLSKLLFMQNPAADSCLHCHSSNANLWSPPHGMKKIEHWIKQDNKPFHRDVGHEQAM